MCFVCVFAIGFCATWWRAAPQAAPREAWAVCAAQGAPTIPNVPGSCHGARPAHTPVSAFVQYRDGANLVGALVFCGAAVGAVGAAVGIWVEKASHANFFCQSAVARAKLSRSFPVQGLAFRPSTLRAKLSTQKTRHGRVLTMWTKGLVRRRRMAFG